MNLELRKGKEWKVLQQKYINFYFIFIVTTLSFF